jgi:hypothetical protein
VNHNLLKSLNIPWPSNGIDSSHTHLNPKSFYKEGIPASSQKFLQARNPSLIPKVSTSKESRPHPKLENFNINKLCPNPKLKSLTTLLTSFHPKTHLPISSSFTHDIMLLEDHLQIPWIFHRLHQQPMTMLI